MAAVETALSAAREAGRPSLVGYVTGGIRPDWPDLVSAIADAGADAIEIGLPFSDPMLDGPVIQEASARAIARGATTQSILARLRQSRPPAVPLIAMAYASHACRAGLTRYCGMLAEAGLRGVIIPDLPAAESAAYRAAAGTAGLDATLMVTPVTPEPQVRAIAGATRGFLYVMSVMNTTGPTRLNGDDPGYDFADRARSLSARPTLIGFGVDSPERAAAAARHADGVIVASALVRLVLAGQTPAQVGAAVAALRSAIDGTRP